MSDHIAVLLKAYERLYCGDVETLYTRALSAELHSSHLRSIAWKLFLGVLGRTSPHTEWPAQIAVHRAAYRELLTAHLVDPREEEELEVDVTANNPLSQEKDSPWSLYFANKELMEEIRKDLERLHPGDEFFDSEAIHEEMLRVLFVWARENPGLSYRQGMHEVLSLFTFVCHTDYAHLSGKCACGDDDQWSEAHEDEPVEGTDGEESGRAGEGGASVSESHSASDESNAALRAELCDLVGVAGGAQDVEADTYALFTMILKRFGRFFDAGRTSNALAVTPLGLASTRIVGTILRREDALLFSHITSRLEIDPQLFLLRWLRLMFLREFHLLDAIRLWDCILADSSETDIEVVEYIAAAMLIYLRPLLLDIRDQGSAFQRLMKYPPVEDVRVFVEMAREGRSGRPMLRLPPAPADEPAPPAQAPAPAPPQQLGMAPAKPTSAPAAPPRRAASAASSAPPRRRPMTEVEQLRVRVAALEGLLENEARRIERIVDTLQENIALIQPSEAGEEEQHAPDVMMALAELKQVRDRFLYRMVVDEFAPSQPQI